MKQASRKPSGLSPAPLLLLLIVGSCCALEPPSELVGYQACRHLMLRLVDCLIDACDLYLGNGLDANTQSEGSIHSHPEDFKGALPLIADPTSEASQNMRGPFRRVIDEHPIFSAEVPVVKAINRFHESIRESAESNLDDLEVEEADDGRNFFMEPAEEEEEEEEEFPSTKPMNWRQTQTSSKPANKNKPAKNNAAELDASMLIGGSCWRPAVEFAKDQLVAIRMDLLVEGQQFGLANCLDKLAKLSVHLASVCAEEQLTGTDGGYLEYVTEAIQVLAEINDEMAAQRESKESPVQGMIESIFVGKAAAVDGEENGSLARGLLSSGAGQGKLHDPLERSATEAIKRHYSYLTQIVTTYNLLFNAIDKDLMGAKHSSAGSFAVGASRKMAAM